MAEALRGGARVGVGGASGVTPQTWYIAVEPQLAMAAPKCFSSSEVGAVAAAASTTGTCQ